PKPDGNKGTAAGTSTGNSSTGTAKSGGTGGRGTASTKQSENAPRVVMVDVPGSDQEEQPKKKRGRPPGTGTKKKSAAKKKTAGNVDSSQLKMLLLTTSAIVAARPGMEDFALTADEAEQICTPLANIMAKSEGVAGVASEYADHIALLIACFTIFIPKFIMWKSKQPKKKEVQKNVLPKRELPKQPTEQRGNESAPERTNQKPAERSGEPTSKQFGGSLHQLIPFGGY
ncbi:hypothetical protein, partial [Streptomyces sp. NPDC054865]